MFRNLNGTMQEWPKNAFKMIAWSFWIILLMIPVVFIIAALSFASKNTMAMTIFSLISSLVQFTLIAVGLHQIAPFNKNYRKACRLFYILFVLRVIYWIVTMFIETNIATTIANQVLIIVLLIVFYFFAKGLEEQLSISLGNELNPLNSFYKYAIFSLITPIIDLIESAVGGTASGSLGILAIFLLIITIFALVYVFKFYIMIGKAGKALNSMADVNLSQQQE